MPRTFEKVVYKFSELDAKAKEKAREWYREDALDYDWFGSSFEDLERVAKILGIEFDAKPVKLMGGGTRYDPIIYFSGFYSQGDGACFEGQYSYAKGLAKAIREYAPEDKELHAIADNLQALQRRNFYNLSARVKRAGHYYHAHSTTIDVSRGYDDAPDDIAESIAEELRDFMQWMYHSLEKECDYLLSDEHVDETIEANEYEFTEEGNRA